LATKFKIQIEKMAKNQTFTKCVLLLQETYYIIDFLFR